MYLNILKVLDVHNAEISKNLPIRNPLKTFSIKTKPIRIN